MKKFGFFIFFTVVFVIYFSANYYVFTRVFSSLAFVPHWRWPIAGGMILLMLAYPLGRILERIHYSTFSNIFHWVGAFWLGILLYAFLYILLVILFITFIIPRVVISTLFFSFFEPVDNYREQIFGHHSPILHLRLDL